MLRYKWRGWIDSASHYLPLPKKIRNGICDWYDLYLGVTPEELKYVNERWNKKVIGPETDDETDPAYD